MKIADSRCLVIGANGFIARSLMRKLAGLGASVHGVVRSSPQPGGFQIHVADATDRLALEKELESARPDVIFNLASVVTGSRSLDVVRPTLENNLFGLVNVLDYVARHRDIRIVTMGSLQEPDETSPGIPNSPYAAAKFSATIYARLFASCFDVDIRVARTFMVYGPGQMDFSKVVPYTLQSILKDETVRLTSGRTEFDWIHVDDVADALIATAAADGLRGETIDIGTGRLTSVRKVIELLAGELNAPHQLAFGELPDRENEPTRVAAVDRARSQTGWSARIPIEEGLRQTARWYKEYLARGPSAEGSANRVLKGPAAPEARH